MRFPSRSPTLTGASVEAEAWRLVVKQLADAEISCTAGYFTSMRACCQELPQAASRYQTCAAQAGRPFSMLFPPRLRD